MNNRQLSIFEDDEFHLSWKLADAFPDRESYDLEYKSAAGGFPNDLWKTYSAFANTMGGCIVLGVKEKKDKIEIEGLSADQINNYKKIFWDNVNNPNTVNINLLREKDVAVLDFEDKRLLVFRIPMAARTEKPVHLTKNPFDNSYKRNYEGDYRCTRDEVRRMLADADNKLHQDSRILEGFSFKDIDESSLNRYRQLFSVSRPSHPWLTLPDKEFLEKLGGYRKDRVSKVEGFTMASLLMFGRYEAITDLECAPAFFPDYRESLSNDDQVRWTDRIYPDGTWETNLFNFYLKVWPKLSSALPRPFQLKEGIRKDDTPAHEALRESLVNALIHTDYSAPGNIVIEHHKDSFTFSNPGTLLVSIWQYYEGGISECRNPSLQKMFLMIGTAEKAGSGANKIMSGWEYAHWRRPFLRIENKPDRVVLELPMFSIIPEDTMNSLRQMFGPETDALGKNELTVLSSCHIEKEITNNRLQYLLDLHRTDITTLLQELCKSGYLISENKGRWTTYHLNDQYNKHQAAYRMDSSYCTVDTSYITMDTSDIKVDTSDIKVDTSDIKVDTSDIMMDTLGDDNGIPDQAVVSLEIKRSRMPKQELFKQITLACNEEFKTIEEIASIVGKDPKYLKNKVFPEMIKTGLIKRLYPTINHPNQAYKA